MSRCFIVSIRCEPILSYASKIERNPNSSNNGYKKIKFENSI